MNLPIVPRPDPPIGRESLLAAVAQAASATAAGSDMPESVRSLDGRQFEIRIRFGCRGPANDLSTRWLGWSFDPEERRIQARATPTISKDDSLIGRIGGDAFEAVEGFWIPRPWLLEPVCPAAAAIQRTEQRVPKDSTRQQADRSQEPQKPQEPASPETGDGEGAEPAPTPPRIGIAQFFTENDPRTRRRDMRPYEARHTLAEGKAISSQGYNLVLAGRLRALPETGVIHCSAQAGDSPPECVVSAEFLRVWIEQPETGEVIAQWGGG